MVRQNPPSDAAGREYVSLREGIELYLRYSKGRVWTEASHRERLHALSVAVRRPLLDAMRESERRYREQDAKSLYYLSMEFLMGRALGNNLTNLGIYDQARATLGDLGEDLGVHDRGSQLGELALGEVGELVVHVDGDDEAEDGVAEELEALVRARDGMLRAVGAVDQGRVEASRIVELASERSLEARSRVGIHGVAPFPSWRRATT